MNNIPMHFTLGGLTVTVELDDQLCVTKNMLGEARYTEQKIILDPKAAHPQTVLHSFWHEVVHWILYVMNEDDLRNNEKYVDLFAHLLYQVQQTSVHYEQELINDDYTPFQDDDIPF